MSALRIIRTSAFIRPYSLQMPAMAIEIAGLSATDTVKDGGAGYKSPQMSPRTILMCTETVRKEMSRDSLFLSTRERP